MFKESCKAHFDTLHAALGPFPAVQDDGLPQILVVSPYHLSDEELRAVGWTEEDLDYGMQSEIDIMFFYDGEQHYLLRSLRDGHTTTKHNVTYRGKTWDTMLTMWH